MLIAQWLTSLRQAYEGSGAKWRAGKKMRKKGRGERSGGEGDAYDEICFERLIPPIFVSL